MQLRGWSKVQESPNAEIAAANRALVSADRRVTDAAHRYRSAVATGDDTAIDAAQQEFRQNWESNVRIKGGNPQDFIPGYQDANIIPGWFFSGWTKPVRRPGNLRGRD